MIAIKLENISEAAVEDVEELSLFVPSGQIMALAEAAESEGLTAAQYIRRLLNQALAISPRRGPGLS